MKSPFKYILLGVFGFMLVSLPAQSADLAIDPAISAQLFDQKNIGQLILVTFKDSSINRIQGGATAYRQRGYYASSTWSQKLGDAIAEDYHLQKLTEWPMTTVGEHCIVYRVANAVSVPEILQRLAEDQRVGIAQNMHVFNTQAQSASDPYYQLQSNLHSMQIDKAHSKTTGKNVTIAVIDTGVDLQHPDLVGQISQNKNFAEGVSDSFSQDKHGTAVAGVIVAKKNNGTGIRGVAPSANVIALKACWPTQTQGIAAICNSLTLALAVNEAIRLDVEILNMSLSGPPDALLSLLLNKAIAEGIIVVAADTGTSNANSNFPASLDNVISVASLKPKSSDYKPSVHSVIAPGEKILTTLPSGTYDFISGSSIAAAEVSGIVALLLELKPDLALPEIQSLLQQSTLAAKLGSVVAINANNAVLALCAKTDCPQDTLSYIPKRLKAENLIAHNRDSFW